MWAVIKFLANHMEIPTVCEMTLVLQLWTLFIEILKPLSFNFVYFQ